MTNGNVITNQGLQDMLNAHFLNTANPPTLMRVGTATTTPNVADTALGNQVNVTTGVANISMISGYPIVDANELFAETRAQLTTTMANGILITESGEFNNDSELQSHAVFDGESKSNTDIFFVVNKTKFRNQT